MRREERVTVQGPVKKQRPDVMSHRGGGGGGAVRCARAVRKVGHVGPLSPPMAKVTSVTAVVPVHRTAQILTTSKNSDNELTQSTFHTENARMLSESAVFAPWT